MLTRSKVKGVLIGGAIGDAMGAPVETWSTERIYKVHPNGVCPYVPPIGHKWFKVEEFLPGMTTDDTQLTVATMQGLIDGKDAATQRKCFDPYLDAIAKRHVEAMDFAVGGWGKSTMEAIRRVGNGVHWSLSGKTTEEGRGSGNGICMKCSPIAMWYGSKVGGEFDTDNGKTFHMNQRLVDFAAMTHYTKIAAHSGILHTHAVYYCLWTDAANFHSKSFLDLIADQVWDWGDPKTEAEKDDHVFYDVSHLESTPTFELEERMGRLALLRDDLPQLPITTLQKMFGNGSCHVYDSLPFTYALFLQDYNSFQNLQRVAEAGGDNDTNAKMVGELMGALHGIELFERPENRWAIDGLVGADKLYKLADEFCDAFGID